MSFYVVVHLSLFILGAMSVKPRYQSMEIIDTVDKITPGFGTV
jgi:hypothetical protein